MRVYLENDTGIIFQEFPDYEAPVHAPFAEIVDESVQDSATRKAAYDAEVAELDELYSEENWVRRHVGHLLPTHQRVSEEEFERANTARLQAESEAFAKVAAERSAQRQVVLEKYPELAGLI